MNSAFSDFTALSIEPTPDDTFTIRGAGDFARRGRKASENDDHQMLATDGGEESL